MLIQKVCILRACLLLSSLLTVTIPPWGMPLQVKPVMWQEARPDVHPIIVLLIPVEVLDGKSKKK